MGGWGGGRAGYLDAQLRLVEGLELPGGHHLQGNAVAAAVVGLVVGEDRLAGALQPHPVVGAVLDQLGEVPRRQRRGKPIDDHLKAKEKGKQRFQLIAEAGHSIRSKR